MSVVCLQIRVQTHITDGIAYRHEIFMDEIAEPDSDQEDIMTDMDYDYTGPGPEEMMEYEEESDTDEDGDSDDESDEDRDSEDESDEDRDSDDESDEDRDSDGESDGDNSAYLTLNDPDDNSSTPFQAYLMRARYEEYIGDLCTICREDLTKENKVPRLTCGHFYHISCLREWLKRSFTCPLCRTTVSIIF